MSELRFAECCGNCKGVAKVNKPQEEHAAHYEVAKTERWCAKCCCYTTREAVCDEFELQEKTGGVPAIKRVVHFNKKLDRIIHVGKKLADAGIDNFEYGGYRYKLSEKEYWCYRYATRYGGDWWWKIDIKSKDSETHIANMEKFVAELEASE